MATIFGHGLLGYTMGKVGMKKPQVALLTLGILFTMLPDLDVLGFFNGVSYDSPWGHRGFTHSMAFALLSAAIGSIFFKSQKKSAFLFLFLCMASHGLLDGLTDGGRGVAYFWPFSDARHFLPWRPILVSPLGLKGFFSQWGYRVIMSEVLYIGLPCIIVLLLLPLFKNSKHGIESTTDTDR
jgi:inner membrane protein